MLFENGSYEASLIQQVLFEKEETGTLNLATLFDVGGHQLPYNFNLIQRDGTMNTRTIGFLKNALGWDGVDFGALQDGNYSDKPFIAVIENEAGREDASKTYSVIRYINLPGGNAAQMPPKADAQKLTAKYGAKFRAISGGVPAGKPTAKPAPSAPAAAPASKPVPAKVGAPPNRPLAKPQEPVSSESECWEKATALKAGAPEEAQAEYFWSVVAKVCGDKTEGISPQEWGKVLGLLKSDEQNLPF